MRNQYGKYQIDKQTKKIMKAKCEICSFSRYTEDCHIIPRKLGGGHTENNIVTLCPNHHKLFDYRLLSKEERSIIEYKLNNLLTIHSMDKRKCAYLYWQLGIINTPPIRMNKLYKILREKNSHIYGY